MKKTILSTLLLALVVSFVFVSCKKKEKEKEKEPAPVVETNYINISGTKYKLTTSVKEENDNLYFYGTIADAEYPKIILEFPDATKPTSTQTVEGSLKVEKSQWGEDQFTTYDKLFTIAVNNGEFSITFPEMTYINSNNDKIVCSGNMTCK